MNEQLRSKAENAKYEYVDYTKKHYNNKLDQMLNSVRTFENNSEYNKTLYGVNDKIAAYEEYDKVKFKPRYEIIKEYMEAQKHIDKELSLELQAKQEFELVFYGPNAKLKEQGKDSKILIELYKIAPIMIRLGINVYNVITALSVFRSLRITKHIGTNTYMRVPDRLLAYRCHLSRNKVELLIAVLTKTDLIKKVKIGRMGEM